MDIGTVLIFILFLMIDIILIYKPVPILAFPVMIFFFYVAVTDFLPLSETTLPMNPLTSVFFIIFCALGILVNGLDLRR